MSAAAVMLFPRSWGTLRADFDKRFFAEAAYSHFGGGNYNLLADRGNLSLVVGAAY